MAGEGKVVVELRLTIEQHSQTGAYAARIRPLGLTAYGPDEETAVRNCKRLFARFIESYRRDGMLKRILDNAGLEWHWASDHAPELPTYEDVGTELPKPAGSGINAMLDEMRQQWREVPGEAENSRALLAA